MVYTLELVFLQCLQKLYVSVLLKGGKKLVSFPQFHFLSLYIPFLDSRQNFILILLFMFNNNFLRFLMVQQ